MKKIKLLKTLLIPTIGITAIGTITAVSTSCSPVVIVNSVSLDKESLALEIGGYETLTATVLPENATDRSVTWSSSDSSVATVDNNGKVTAVGKGRATITVKTNDGGFTDTCQVTVRQEIIHVIGVSLNKELLTLGEGESETLTATVLPANATDKSVTWSSSNPSVATVDNNGKVIAVKEGQATITVKTNDGGFTDTCQVTVNQKIQVIGVLLDKKSLTLVIDDFETLTATVHPENAADKSVTWSSSNSNVATVDNNGKVTAISEGYAIITVTTNDGGFTATCPVTVNQKIPVTSVFLDKISLTLVKGDFETLTATVYPENAADKSVTWSSSDSGVATVYNNGKVYATSLGSAKIMVKTNDGGYQDYCDVTVVEPSAVYMCVTANADSTLELRNEGGNNPNLQYSVDRRIWRNYSDTINIPAGSMYYLKGNNLADWHPDTGWSQSTAKFSHFYITGNVSLSGNVMALLDNATGALSSIPNDYCFYGLFSNSPGITSVSENFLPATTLTKNCYDRMFIGCSSLTTVPTFLPATTLAANCYYSMFSQCTSLTSVPAALPATTLAVSCYSNMFIGCTSLTTALDLPATTLANNCYESMFANCTSLTTAPELPATTLADYCYKNMFASCTSLRFFPYTLPATTLTKNCYEGMFENCRFLSKAPAILATTLGEYSCSSMFINCKSLTVVPDLLATNLDKFCYEYMFSSCISLAIAPALPATKLAYGCYLSMFQYCSSLQSAPDLPATELAPYCYYYMFYKCYELSSVRIGYTGTPAEAPTNAFSYWVSNVASVGIFYYTGTDLDPIANFGFASDWTHQPY